MKYIYNLILINSLLVLSKLLYTDTKRQRYPKSLQLDLLVYAVKHACSIKPTIWNNLLFLIEHITHIGDFTQED